LLSQALKPQSGEIRFRGKPLGNIDPLKYRRQISLVLQDPLLLNTTVFNNVATGLRFRGAPNQTINKRVDYWLERMGISHLRNRQARSLSGGESQRVSLARALVLEPDILLLDEPFSALDSPTRISLLSDFQSVIASTSPTTVFVTHDLDEVLMLSHNVAVLIGGKLRQAGTPVEVFNAPTDPEIASFVGMETIIDGNIMKNENGHLSIKANGTTLEAVGDLKQGRVYLCLRPEDITLNLPSGSKDTLSSARNQLKGVITHIIPQGPLARVEVNCEIRLVALITQASAKQMDLAVGKEVTACFKSSAIHLIRR
jgi:molybdopterin-binding protein